MTSGPPPSHVRPTLKKWSQIYKLKTWGKSSKKACLHSSKLREGRDNGRHAFGICIRSQHSEEQTRLWACSALISTVRSQMLIRWLFSNFREMGDREWNRLWCKTGSFIYPGTSTPDIPLDSFSLSTSEQLMSNKFLQDSEITCLKDL